MASKPDYVQLGLTCADVCRVLDRGMGGKELDDLSQSVCEAIERLTMCVKSAMRGSDDLLTILLIAELWWGSRRRSSRRVDGVYPPDFSTRIATRKRLPFGS